MLFPLRTHTAKLQGLKTQGLNGKSSQKEDASGEEALPHSDGFFELQEAAF